MTGDSGSAPVVIKMLRVARKKFDQLDANGNGLLEGYEIDALADWVWSRFHPGGEPLSDEQMEDFGAKLLTMLDVIYSYKHTFMNIVRRKECR